MKHPKQKVLAKIVLVLMVCGVFFVGAWWWLNKIDSGTIGSQVTLTRVVMNGEKTSTAYSAIPFLHDRKGSNYLNLAIDLNHDGKIASYTVNATTQEEWVVQNFPLPVFADEGVNANFTLSDFDVDSKKDFSLTAVLTTQRLDNWDGGRISGSAMRTVVVATIGIEETSDRATVDPNGIGSTGPGDASVPPGQPVKEKTVSSLAKEFSVFHEGVPDMDQKINECVPTSAANSLRWLAKGNNFTDKLPLSDTELLGELKDDMKWKVESGIIVDQNFLTGKDAFVSRHKLPIVTHQVGGKFDINIVAKIAEELRKGQDVEIDMEYGEYKADGSYERRGGHMVTVVGATGTADSQYLDIHDPLSSGPSKLDRYKIDGTRVVDYKYEGKAVTYIRYAYAESPTTPPSEPVNDSTTPPDGTTTTPVIQSPVLIGKFITVGQENGDGQITITITPEKVYDQEITKMTFDLSEFKELPASAVVYVHGDEQSDWTCLLEGTEYACEGALPLAEGVDSTFELLLDAPFSFCPPKIDATVYVGDEVATTVQVERE